MKVLYTAHGTATGEGRGGGTAYTDDGKVSVHLSVPKAMGGDDGPGTNPEQLFAVGYSACFLGAMRAASRRLKITLPAEAQVVANVSFADREDGVGYTIKAALTATAPGLDPAQLRQLVDLAHQICPYSNLITAAHDVELNVA